MTDDDDKIEEALEKFHRERNGQTAAAAPFKRAPSNGGATFQRGSGGASYYTIPWPDERMSTRTTFFPSTTTSYVGPVGSTSSSDSVESFSSMEGIRVKDRGFSRGNLDGVPIEDLIPLGENYFMDRRTRRVWNPQTKEWSTSTGPLSSY